MILLDANILLRLAQSSSPLYRTTQGAIFSHRKTNTLVICPQSLYEFWAVATRELAVNGFGMDTKRAFRWVDYFGNLFKFVEEPSGILKAWALLVKRHQVTGFRAHDARYIALMQLLGISQFMTYNVKHFSDYPISIITPHSATTSN